MSKLRASHVCVFILGMLTFAIGYWLLTTFIFVERPDKNGIIEDWDEICFWPDEGGLYLSISPKGCFSTTCTSPKLQTGTAVVDLQNKKIELGSRFILVNTSRFPLPCIDNCSGGTLQFILEPLIPNDYEVWFNDEKVGNLNIFSGRPTPRQCFNKTPD